MKKRIAQLDVLILGCGQQNSVLDEHSLLYTEIYSMVKFIWAYVSKINSDSYLFAIFEVKYIKI